MCVLPGLRVVDGVDMDMREAKRLLLERSGKARKNTKGGAVAAAAAAVVAVVAAAWVVC